MQVHHVHTLIRVCVGLVAGLAGLVAARLASVLLGVRADPPSAIAEVIVRLTPGFVIERVLPKIGALDKPLLYGVILLAAFGIFAGAGLLWHPKRRVACALWAGAGLVALAASYVALPLTWTTGVPAAAGVAVAVGVLAWLSRWTDEPVVSGDREDPVINLQQRRGLLIGTGVVAAAAISGGIVGALLTRQRRAVDRARALVRLPSVTRPGVPKGARLAGLPRWRTRNDEFYVVDTAFTPPAIDVTQWRLRVHGMVDRELNLSFDELASRSLIESWVTLGCVSNEVGGDLIGNAWWSGISLADLLVEAGVDARATAVLQTSQDGWTCLTPLETLTDDRGAMLAVAMNGHPLPVEHGFPVRTLVPGLYGYVSACKWVVDLKVTTFERDSGYWTDKGWSELGPSKAGSRIDLPADGDEVPLGEVRIGGVAWHQHVGIKAVEVALDGGPWLEVALGTAPNKNTWVQWQAKVSATAGEHVLRVRAISTDGETQTGVLTEPAPNGATGWHQITFTAV